MNKEKIKDELNVLPSVSRVETNDFGNLWEVRCFLNEEKLKEHRNSLYEVPEYFRKNNINFSYTLNEDESCWEFYL